jgi:hypothetical protein
VCGDCGGRWAGWLRGGTGALVREPAIGGTLGGAPLTTGVWPFVNCPLESPKKETWAVRNVGEGMR